MSARILFAAVLSAAVLSLAVFAPAGSAQQTSCPTPVGLGPSPHICDVLGSTHMGATYGFGEECSLQEGARRLVGFGTRTIKVSLYDPPNRYRFGSCDWSGVTAASPPAAVAAKPAFRELFAMPFTTYLLQTFSSLGPSYFTGGVSSAQCAQERAEMYDLAAHLLKTYAGTRKQFVIQNWEMDWALRGHTDPEQPPSATAVEGGIRFLQCRQAGIAMARSTILSGAKVMQACEVNLVGRALDGRPGAAIDDVIPRSRCDLVSYSAWDTIGAAASGDVDQARARFRAALSHIAARTPDPGSYVRAAICPYRENVFVGEFGWPENDVGTEAAMRVIRMATEESLRWKARWVVYWQLYDNELRNPVSGRPTDADVRGFYLIKPSGLVAAAGAYLAGVLRTALPVAPDNCTPPPPPARPGFPAQPSGDQVAPRISAIRLRRSRLSLRVSEPATVRATIARRVRRGRWKRVVRARVVHAPTAGRVQARLRPLRRGRYRVTVRAQDAVGNRSQVRRRARIRN